MNVAKALYEYWSSFGIDAYPEYNVAQEATFPYITYDLKAPDWRGEASYNARVWYSDTSYSAITRMVDTISADIGEGKRLVMDNGYIYLFKADSFIQYQPMEEDYKNIKVALLTLVIHVLA